MVTTETDRTRWVPFVVLALTTVALWPVVHGGFVRDDLEGVVRDQLVSGNLALGRLFAGDDPLGRWHPLAWVAWKAGHLVGGGSAAGFHAISLVLHLAATAVAYLLARRLSGSVFIGFFAGTLFGLHPVQVESVAWIGSLDTVLAGLFGLLALDAHRRWRDRDSGSGNRGLPLLAGIYLALAFCASELAIAVVPLAIALDVGMPPRAAVRSRFSARAYGPLVAAALVVYAARALAFGELAAGLDRATFAFNVSSTRTAWLRGELLGGLIGLVAWPLELLPSRPFVLEPETFARATLAPLLWIGALGAAIAWTLRRDIRPMLAALLWIPAAILPVLLRVRTLGPNPLSDQLAYLAVFGAVLAAPLALAHLPRTPAAVALGVLVLACGTLTHRQTAVWRDDAAVLEASTTLTSRGPAHTTQLGQASLERYRVEADPELLREAFERFQDSLDLLTEARTDPSIFTTREDHIAANLGLAWCLWYEAVLDEHHDYQIALGVFEQITDRYPEVVEAWIGLAVAQSALGHLGEAEVALDTALKHDPHSARALHNLGQVYVRRGQWTRAAEAFQQAHKERPGHLDDLVWEARSWVQAGEPDRARAALARARDGHPESSAPLVVEGNLAASEGDLDRALELAKGALDIEPDDGEGLLLVGKLHAARDETASATESLQRACRLLPESFEAHYNAAALLLSTHGAEVALPYLARAYRLRADDDAGRRLAETLRQLEVKSPLILFELASEDARRGDDAHALEWTERAIGLRPDRIEPYLLKGEVLSRSGDIDGAVVVFTYVCDNDPDNLRGHTLLGALLQDNERDGALYHLERALALAQTSSLPPATRRSTIQSLQSRLRTLREGH
jgi:tetratricopeptide (TPR) repeat protein